MTPLVLDLPFPPTMNRIWKISRRNGKTQVYLNPKYVAWKLQCDRFFYLANVKQKDLPIEGPVKLDITLSLGMKRGDADNRIKAVQDWLQRAGVVANDEQIWDVRAHWGEAAHGCRVVVEPIPEGDAA